MRTTPPKCFCVPGADKGSGEYNEEPRQAESPHLSLLDSGSTRLELYFIGAGPGSSLGESRELAGRFKFGQGLRRDDSGRPRFDNPEVKSTGAFCVPAVFWGSGVPRYWGGRAWPHVCGR